MEDEDYRIMFENSVQIASERKIRVKDSGLSFKDMTSEERADILRNGTIWIWERVGALFSVDKLQ